MVNSTHSVTPPSLAMVKSGILPLMRVWCADMTPHCSGYTAYPQAELSPQCDSRKNKSPHRGIPSTAQHLPATTTRRTPPKATDTERPPRHRDPRPDCPTKSATETVHTKKSVGARHRGILRPCGFQLHPIGVIYVGIESQPESYLVSLIIL